VGRKVLIEKVRKHPLMRAVRVDKMCLMVLERTLHLFRDPARLVDEHPTFRMACAPLDVVKSRAENLAGLLAAQAPNVKVQIRQSQAFLGSGSLPNQAIPSFELMIAVPDMSADALARALRLDDACVFGRIQDDCVRLDVRTVTDEQLPAIAAALGRLAS
jgi:L-seryl-tRNA(Ser) seleniumtransferase